MRQRLPSSFALRLALGLFGAACLPAGAQNVPANEAIPFYSTTQAVQALYAQWLQPQSAASAQAGQQLVAALEQLCAAPTASPAALDSARQAFATASQSWDRLGSVALGALVERRSARQIDFQPPRPNLIQKAIATAPADLRAMERVGAPAKGFPTLELLLWDKAQPPAGPRCTYALRVGQDIANELQQLRQAFATAASHDWEEDEDATRQAIAEFINQWVGGVERLRWAQMEKPLRSAGKKTPELPRMASGGSIASWQAQWSGLRQMAIAVDRKVPQAGQDLIPIESYLRGRGLNALADRWFASVEAADRALRQLQTTDLASVQRATQPLAQLKRLMEAEVAPALEINIGFSDADGD